MIIMLLICIAIICPIIYYHVLRGWQIIHLLKYKKQQIREKEAIANTMMNQDETNKEQYSVKELDENDPMFA